MSSKETTDRTRIFRESIGVDQAAAAFERGREWIRSSEAQRELTRADEEVGQAIKQLQSAPLTVSRILKQSNIQVSDIR